jgi:hypothetical protein
MLSSTTIDHLKNRSRGERKPRAVVNSRQKGQGLITSVGWKEALGSKEHERLENLCMAFSRFSRLDWCKPV